jgi:hypothetical protein
MWGTGMAMALKGGKSARELYRMVLCDLDNRQRRNLRFRSAAARKDGGPMIYVWAPDYDRPAGGTMVLYRHVDVLNEAGIPAAALHKRPGFRYGWFENKTRTISLAEAFFAPGDIVVFPEAEIDLVARLPPQVGYVIFNQNSHLTWKRGDEAFRAYHPGRANLLGVVVVSRHNLAMLSHSFEGTPIARMHLGIDAEKFWSPRGDRPRRISYMPRRGGADAELVLRILEQRGALDGWEVEALDGLSHDAVAERLRASSIFMAFTYQEGFGLPAAEAMACGNYVIGYHGLAGREFFEPRFSVPIETGDVLAFARAVEDAMEKEETEPGWLQGMGAAASEYILSNYSREREVADIVSIYARYRREALAHHSIAAPAERVAS